MKYEYVGTVPTTLAHGQPVAFGDVVDLSKSRAGENAALIDAGALAPVERPDAKSGKQSTPETGEEGDE